MSYWDSFERRNRGTSWTSSRPYEKDLPEDILDLVRSTTVGVHRLYSTAASVGSGSTLKTSNARRASHTGNPKQKEEEEEETENDAQSMVEESGTGTASMYSDAANSTNSIDDSSSSRRCEMEAALGILATRNRTETRSRYHKVGKNDTGGTRRRTPSDITNSFGGHATSSSAASRRTLVPGQKEGAKRKSGRRDDTVGDEKPHRHETSSSPKLSTSRAPKQRGGAEKECTPLAKTRRADRNVVDAVRETDSRIPSTQSGLNSSTPIAQKQRNNYATRVIPAPSDISILSQGSVGSVAGTATPPPLAPARSTFGERWERTFEAITSKIHHPSSAADPTRTGDNANTSVESAVQPEIALSPDTSRNESVGDRVRTGAGGQVDPRQSGGEIGSKVSPPSPAPLPVSVPNASNEAASASLVVSPSKVKDGGSLANLRQYYESELDRLREKQMEERQCVAQETAAHLHASFAITVNLLKAELEGYKERAAESSEMLDQAKTLTQQANTELRTVRARNLEMEDRLKKSEGEVRALRKRVVEVEQQLAKREENADRMRAQLEAAQSSAEETRRKEHVVSERLKHAEQQLLRERQENKQRLDSKHAEYAAATQGYEQLLGVATAKLDEFDRLQSRFSQYRSKQKKRVEELQSTLRASEAKEKGLHDRILELKNAVHDERETAKKARADLQDEQTKHAAAVADLTKRLSAQETAAKNHADAMEWERRASEKDVTRRGEECDALREALRAFEMIKVDLEAEAKRLREESAAKEQESAESFAKYKQQTEETIAALRRQLREKDVKLELLAASATEPVQRLRKQLEQEQARRATAEERLEDARKKVKEAEEAARLLRRKEQLRSSHYALQSKKSDFPKEETVSQRSRSGGSFRAYAKNVSECQVRHPSEEEKLDVDERTGLDERTQDVPHVLPKRTIAETTGLKPDIRYARKLNPGEPASRKEQIPQTVTADGGGGGGSSPLPVDRTALPVQPATPPRELRVAAPSVSQRSPITRTKDAKPRESRVLFDQESGGAERFTASVATTPHSDYFPVVSPASSRAVTVVSDSRENHDVFSGTQVSRPRLEEEYVSAPQDGQLFPLSQESDAVQLDDHGVEAAQGGEYNESSMSIVDMMSDIVGRESPATHSSAEQLWSEDERMLDAHTRSNSGSATNLHNQSIAGGSRSGNTNTHADALPDGDVLQTQRSGGAFEYDEGRIEEYEESSAAVYRRIIGSRQTFLEECAAVVRSIPPRRWQQHHKKELQDAAAKQGSDCDASRWPRKKSASDCVDDDSSDTM